jgi:hypothetical protein
MAVDVTLPRDYTGPVFVSVVYNDDGTGDGYARAIYTASFIASGAPDAAAINTTHPRSPIVAHRSQL